MPRINASEYNLLKKFNPYFENAPTFTAATNVTARWLDGTAAGSQAADSAWKWGIVSGTTSGTYAAQFDNTVSHSGTYSLKVSTLASASAAEVGTCRAISLPELLRNGIPVSGSTSYTARVWMKTNYVSGSSTNGAFINLNERNVSAGGAINNQSTKITATTDWTQYTLTFTTASATRFIVPRCAMSGTGGSANLVMDAWFDEFELFPTALMSRLALT